MYDLDRFLTAQRRDYAAALREIQNGRKRSHWIWYIFPQVAGLGMSSTSQYYAISGLDEARAYLREPTLRAHLLEISSALLALDESDPTAVFGFPDDLKLRSSMTLFAAAAPDEPVFSAVLDKFFGGQPTRARCRSSACKEARHGQPDRNQTHIRKDLQRLHSRLLPRHRAPAQRAGTAPRELSRHVGAVCIVPLLDDGRVIVERQFRYPVNEVITEIPAGKRDSRDEAPEAAARRELREETGITARELIPLGPFYPAAAYSDEVIWMYLARGLTFGEQQLDDDEFLNLQAVPLDELARDVLAGRIPDAKTQAAILRVYCMAHGFEPK